MPAAAIVAAMAMAALMAILLGAVTVYIAKLHKAYNSLVDDNIALQLENTGMEAEIDRCHREIDEKNAQISKLIAEKLAANAASDRSWSEF